jgi:hypothetical protein
VRKHHFKAFLCSGQSGGGDSKDICGDPFTGQAPISRTITWTEAIHGNYYLVKNEKVWYKGSPSDNIGCAQAAFQDPFTRLPRQLQNIGCGWVGPGPHGNGGRSATYGHHITAFGNWQFRRAYLTSGDNDGFFEVGDPLDWGDWVREPIALYIWTTNHIGQHKTECFDCY